MRALDAGPMEALQAKYGNIREAEGYIHDANLNPSIIFKVKSEAIALSIEKKDYIPALFSMK
jgi:hypothetical protein